MVRGQLICHLSPEGPFSAASAEVFEVLWAPSIVLFEVLWARTPHLVQVLCTSTGRVLLQVVWAATAVLLVLRATTRPLLLKVFRTTTQNVLWDSFWAAAAVLLWFRYFDNGFVVLRARPFQVMIGTARTPGLLQVLGADTPVFLVLRAPFPPRFLQVFWTGAWVVFVMVWAVSAARAGGAAAIPHISDVGAGGRQLAQADLAVDGAPAACSSTLLLIQQHTQLLQLQVLLNHFFLPHFQLFQLLQVQGHLLVHDAGAVPAQALPLAGHPLALLPVVIQEAAQVPQLLVIFLQLLVDVL